MESQKVPGGLCPYRIRIDIKIETMNDLEHNKKGVEHVIYGTRKEQVQRKEIHQ